MRFRLGVMTGMAVGYYLGAKAGRERYEQINEALGRVRRSETFESAADSARATLAEVSETARATVEDTVGSARDLVESRIGNGQTSDEGGPPGSSR
ncbi:MAG: YtxH domain-containing protein [Acidimicrobiales bacterium]